MRTNVHKSTVSVSNDLIIDIKIIGKEFQGFFLLNNSCFTDIFCLE